MADDADKIPEFDFKIETREVKAKKVPYDPPRLLHAEPDERHKGVMREIVQWPNGYVKVRGVSDDGRLVYFAGTLHDHEKIALADKVDQPVFWPEGFSFG